MQNEELGSIKISDDVIAACVANAVNKIPGVYRFAGGLTESISRNILGKEYGNKGIKISQEDEGVVVDLYVIVEYLTKIPQLAWEVQSLVKSEIESVTEQTVAEVNIHVQGVHLPGEEEE